MIEQLIALNWNCASKGEDFGLEFVFFFSPGLADSPVIEPHRQETELPSSELRFVPSLRALLAWKQMALRADPFHSTANCNILGFKKEESQG